MVSTCSSRGQKNPRAIKTAGSTAPGTDLKSSVCGMVPPPRIKLRAIMSCHRHMPGPVRSRTARNASVVHCLAVLMCGKKQVRGNTAPVRPRAIPLICLLPLAQLACGISTGRLALASKFSLRRAGPKRKRTSSPRFSIFLHLHTQHPNINSSHYFPTRSILALR